MPTADELEQLIVHALEAGDVEGAVLALRLLVGVDARRAAAVYDTMKAGLLLRGRS